MRPSPAMRGPVMNTTPYYRLLGPLSVMMQGKEVPIKGKRHKALMAVLLLEANNVVDIESLIDAMWGESPPMTAKSQVRICVSELRRRFSLSGEWAGIETHPSGYLLRVPDGTFDLFRFTGLVREGRRAADVGHTESAAADLRAALDLWQGPIAPGVESLLVRSAAARYEEDRLTVLEEYFDLELLVGNHSRVVGELTREVSQNPFRERMCGQLMLALYLSNRQVDALSLFQSTRRRLVDDLGLEPSRALRDIEDAILSGAVAPLPDARFRAKVLSPLK
ncbi:AfsR/SARP family transcriptional regulator [Nocardiopsis sp. NPDC006832]|uniref:AfsR/SARP family transcriptional regulator n=1 Tax=Nocardiopsis sp. NPDC006832 TaxID=3157188 RepID=UPI0034054813